MAWGATCVIYPTIIVIKDYCLKNVSIDHRVVDMVDASGCAARQSGQPSNQSDYVRQKPFIQPDRNRKCQTSMDEMIFLSDAPIRCPPSKYYLITTFTENINGRFRMVAGPCRTGRLVNGPYHTRCFRYLLDRSWMRPVARYHFQ